ncbi:MAG: hypothetical protein KatS3mg061_0983 [Dehalococcoidia bacterium]|nr:MAG: hypothetical protein KatS3mg061_0983 [Dehalococcoidia bacterium]
MSGVPPRWLVRVQGGLALVLMLGVLLALWQRWDQVRAERWQLAPLPLALSLGVLVAALLLWALVWAGMLRRLGATARSRREIAWVYLSSNLARYLPGAVWNLVARAYLGGRYGLGQRRVWTATAIDLGLAVASGLLIYLLSGAVGAPVPVPVPIAAGGALVVLALISPPVLAGLDRRLAARSGRGVVLGWRELGGYLGCSLLIWVAIGLAFGLLLSALYPLEPVLLPAAAGAWSLAVVVGLVAPGVPQGLGVREGVLMLMLASLVPLPTAAALAVASRFWMICGDVLAVGIWWTVGVYATKRRARTLRGWPASEATASSAGQGGG